MSKTPWVWAAAGLLALSFGSAARAILPKSYQQQATFSPNLTDARGIAVNKNRWSPYYGYVYVAASKTNTVRILRPSKPEEGTGAPGLVDTGLTITTSGQPYNLFGVCVGQDDTVWLMGSQGKNVDAAPPVPQDGTTVAAKTQFTVDGTIYRPYSISVQGDLYNARVYVRGDSARVSLYSGSADAWNGAGQFTREWTTDAGAGFGSEMTTTFGLATDGDGNAYVAIGWEFYSTQNPAIRKILPNGLIDGGFQAVRPPFTSMAGMDASVSVVESPSEPGGGYLYYDAVNYSTLQPQRLVSRYRLDNGQYLDGFGAATSIGYNPPTDATYTVLNKGDENSDVAFSAADDRGNLYMVTDQFKNVTKIRASTSFVAAAGAKASATAPVYSSPVAVDGVVYFGSDDGNLYAYNTENGEPAPGFPVNAVFGITGRPAVYTIDGVKRIYFMTRVGELCRVDADGRNLKKTLTSIGAMSNATPAVLPDGSVLVATGGFMGNALYQYDASLTLVRSQILNQMMGMGSLFSSVAVAGGKVYVASDAPTPGVWVLNAADLTPIATSLPLGEGTSAPPYVVGGSMYVGTSLGNFYKINAVTGTPDLTFGAQGAQPTPGRAFIGEGMTSSPFYRDGKFYVGTTQGKVFAVDAETGEFSRRFDTGSANEVIGGIAMSPWGDTLAFGTSQGTIYTMERWQDGEVKAYRGHGAITTTPTLDMGSMSFFFGSTDSNVYKAPYDPPVS